MFSEETHHNMIVVHHAGHLLPAEQALLHAPGGAPVEDSGAVIVIADQI